MEDLDVQEALKQNANERMWRRERANALRG